MENKATERFSNDGGLALCLIGVHTKANPALLKQSSVSHTLI